VGKGKGRDETGGERDIFLLLFLRRFGSECLAVFVEMSCGRKKCVSRAESGEREREREREREGERERSI